MAGDPEEQVHDVVLDRHLEQPEQPGVGLVAGERQIVEVGGETAMKTSTPTSRKTMPTMAAAFCTFVRVPRAALVRSDVMVCVTNYS
jgi:ribosomal protein S5